MARRSKPKNPIIAPKQGRRPSKKDREHISIDSRNLLGDRLEVLQTEFPEVFTDGKVDFEKLRAALGDIVDTSPERYTFSWAGKKDALQILQMPSRATLTPAAKESIDFDKSNNIFIEGDNLEVLKLLYKPYFARIKTIYIDPPFNTGKDFIYQDNFADPLDAYLKLTGQKDAQGNLLTTNPETSGRFHSVWLSMMYPRLFIARQLLREDGLIFVSVDDNEVNNLRMILNEIFGEENFVEQIVWKSKFGAGAKPRAFITLHEYVLVYARNASLLTGISIPMTGKVKRIFNKKDEKFEERGYYGTWPLDTTSLAVRPNLRFPIIWRGKEIWPKKQWLWSKERVQEALRNNELIIKEKDGKFTVRYKKYEKDAAGLQKRSTPLSVIDNIYTQDGTKELAALGLEEVFDFPKPAKLIREFLKIQTSDLPDAEEIVMDFFAGSCSTAQAVLEENREDGRARRFIMVQLPEPTGIKKYPTIAEIGKERIRRVVKVIRKEKDGKLSLKTGEDMGFRVFKLAGSNFRQWGGVEEREPEAYASQMSWFVDSLVEGWHPINVAWEVALREGLSLSSRVEEIGKLKDNTVWRVTDPENQLSFLICLDEKIKHSTIERLELRKDDLFICRDSALTDELAANLALQCRLKTI